VVLVLRGLLWLHRGANPHVEVVSVWRESRAVSMLIERELLNVTTHAPSSVIARYFYDFAQRSNKDVALACDELAQRARDTDGKLFLLIDEVSREVW
jgi:hypothetical protein